ncbi:T9SS type B sorting domain-containing protein [Gaetbulibacter aquiaggeris]|uniref:T9SS type B sorting domain-containing protein n=1 Tax=Gaetbulibacter aquiaggeris TaxID=1735373 RepID=A0ABW7MNB9_9FLAO
MKKIALLFTFFFISFYSYSQNEAANWYFGDNAGIRFNVDGTITSLSNGQLSTEEGCTSISDNNGDLLFYTDGRFVYDRNGNVMPNGSNLYGDKSSTQSAIIIPNPGNLNIYYVFTVDTSIGPGDPDYGFNYSIVDLSLGDVTTKNFSILSDSSEKISAVVKDCESKSIWVITFSSKDGLTQTTNNPFNTFYAYEVTAAGVNPNPVTRTFDIDISDGRGYLKFSPDGTKLVCANATSGLYLYDFDASSGVVSNQKEIPINFSPNLSKPQSAYGVEFSQNNNVLYVSAFYNPNSDEFNLASEQYGSLLQYDLTAANISSTEIVIDKRQMYRGALQLGPDGKIYRAMSNTYNNGSPFLSVINNPNIIGLGCDYKHNAIPLTRNSRQGLPPFITSFFSQKIDIIGNNATSNDLPLCTGEIYTLNGIELPGALYQWSLNGIIQVEETDFYLPISKPGLYKLLIDPNDGNCDRFEGQALVTYNENPKAFQTTLIQCDEDGTKDGQTIFNLNEANSSLTDPTENVFTKFYKDATRLDQILNPDNYINDPYSPIIFVEVINSQTGCSTNTELVLNVSVTDSNDVELIVCDDDGIEDGKYNFNLREADSKIITPLTNGLVISYYEFYEDALIEQNNLGDTFKNTEPYSQTIYARVENTNNCYGISELLLTVNKLPEIKTDDIVYYCLNKYPETIIIDANVINDAPDNYTYSWSTEESTYEIQVNEPGTYKVLVTNSNNCTKERTVVVEPANIATFETIKVVDAAQNNIITVFVSGEGTYEYSLLDSDNILYRPYQNSNIFENIAPGFYTIYVKDVKNNCGNVNKKVSVIGFPKYFTPNNDGMNDTWQVYGVSSLFQPDSKIFIFDRYGKLLKQLKPTEKGWDGSFNGKILPTDDYWFSVILQDGRVFKSHFTLKN